MRFCMLITDFTQTRNSSLASSNKTSSHATNSLSCFLSHQRRLHSLKNITIHTIQWAHATVPGGFAHDYSPADLSQTHSKELMITQHTRRLFQQSASATLHPKQNHDQWGMRSREVVVHIFHLQTETKILNLFYFPYCFQYRWNPLSYVGPSI